MSASTLNPDYYTQQYQPQYYPNGTWDRYYGPNTYGPGYVSVFIDLKGNKHYYTSPQELDEIKFRIDREYRTEQSRIIEQKKIQGEMLKHKCSGLSGGFMVEKRLEYYKRLHPSWKPVEDHCVPACQLKHIKIYNYGQKKTKSPKEQIPYSLPDDIYAYKNRERATTNVASSNKSSLSDLVDTI